MNGQLDVSPAELRHHARAVEEVEAGVRRQLGEVEACHVNEGGFGVFFGWMAGRFTRTTQELVDGLETQVLLLDRYATGLRHTATEFEQLEEAIARLFAVGEGR